MVVSLIRLRVRFDTLIVMEEIGINNKHLTIFLFSVDPHSGNLLLTKNGQLCYLDFGLLINIPPKERQAMMAALVHLGLGEWKRLVDDLEE